MAEVEMEAIGFHWDHLPKLLVILPKYSSVEVREIKKPIGLSVARGVPLVSAGVLEGAIIWSAGYFVSSVGVDAETIKRYIEYQGTQDSGDLHMKL